MAKIRFDIQADYQKIALLREEVVKLKAELASGGNTKGVDSMISKLNGTKKELDSLIKSTANTEAAIVQMSKGGANATAAMAGSIKSNMRSAEQEVDNLARQMIEKKSLIKSIEAEAAKFKARYNTSYGQTKWNALSEYNGTQKALRDERGALVELGAKQGEAKIKVRELKREYQDYTDTLKKGHSVTKDFTSLLAKVGGIYAIKELGQQIIGATGQIQMLNVSFTTLLQSKEKANKVMAEIIQTAVTTPFQLTDLATGAKQLIAYGFAAEEVNGTLLKLGNVAAALGLPLERLTYLYGTTRTQGRLYARDMLQFTTSGIPVLQGLADMYGKSTAEINKMVSAGKIGFPEVEKVFEQMTGKGGKFYNLMQEQAKTIPGQLSNLKDSMTMMFNDIGSSQTGLISGTISVTKAMVDNYEKVGKMILTLIATYGIYNTALLIAAASNGTLMTSNAALVTGFVKVKNAIIAINAALMANPYAATAAAVLLLVGTMWALHDSTTAQERAQKNLNAVMEQAKARKEGVSNNAQSLINSITSETSSVREQVKAWEELIKKYEFFSKYTVDDLRKMTEGERKKLFSNFIDNFDIGDSNTLYENKLKEISALEVSIKEANDKRFTIGYPVAMFMVNEYTKALNIAKEEAKILKQNLESYDKTTKKAEFQGLSPEKREAIFKAKKENLEAQKALAETSIPEGKAKEGILKSLQDQIKEVTAELEKFRGSDSVKSADYWDKQKKDAEEALKAIDSTSIAILSKSSAKDLKSGNVKGVSPMVVESYRTNKALLDQADDALQKYAFSKNEKREETEAERKKKAAEKLAEQTKKDSEKEIELRKELDNNIAKANIDAMAEGFDKEMAELKFEHENKKRAIEEMAANLLEAESNVAKDKWLKAGGTEADFKPSSTLSTGAATGIATANKNEDNAFVTATTNLLNKLLGKYEDYATKKLEIETQFNLDVKALEKSRTSTNSSQIDAAIAEATRVKNNNISEAQKKLLDKAGIGDILDDSSAYILKKVKEILPFFHSISEASTAELQKIKQVIDSIEIPQDIIDDLLKQGVDMTLLLELSGKLKSGKSNATKEVNENLKEDYIKLANVVGDALSKSSDDFVAKIGSVISTIATSLGAIQGGNGFSKASGIISLAIAAGNYLKEIRLWNENKEINAQKAITEQIAKRITFETEINRLVAERNEKESSNLFTGKNYGKILGDNLALIDKQNKVLNGSLNDLFNNAVFTSEGSAKRNLFGTKTGDYEFSLLNILTGQSPKMPAGNILDWFGVGTGGGSEFKITGDLIKRITSGDWLGAIGKVLDPLHIFGGGDADNKARINAFENLQKAVSGALSAMGKSVSDFSTMSAEDMLTFFDLMEKGGNITDEGTKKLLASAKEQLAAAKEAEEKIKEVITELAGGLGNELRDSLVKNFKEGFAYGENAVNDFRKSMNKVLEDMLANQIFQAAFSGLFEGLEKEMKDSFALGGDKSWIDDFQKFLQQIPEATDMFNEGMTEAQKLGKEKGFDFWGNDTQQEKSGGFQSMSQDSADELSGRFTAMQMSTISLEQRSRESLIALTEIHGSINSAGFEEYHRQSLEMADEMRAQSVQAVRHLAKIEKNTDVLPEMAADMKKVVTNTNNL